MKNKGFAISMYLVVLFMCSLAYASDEVDYAALEQEYGSALVDHEPIVGVYVGSYSNDSYRNWGIYAEYMAWFKRNGYDLGLGAFGMYSEGESQISSYEGKEGILGPQFGIQHTYSDDEGDLQQLQLKLRPVWWHGEGATQEGYWKKQDNFLIGLYAEYLQRINGGLIVGIHFDAWLDLFSPINFVSSWSGDSPEDRTALRLEGFAQYQINDDWAIKGGLGPFYQGWDQDPWGIGTFMELRWRETVMFGPRFAWTPAGFSFMGFVRAEFGDWLREQRAVSYFDAVNKKTDRPEVEVKQN